MKRRELFIGALAAWPLTASAQQTAKVPRIGYLVTNFRINRHLFEAFLERLRELGYVDGRNLVTITAMPKGSSTDFLLWPPNWPDLTST